MSKVEEKGLPKGLPKGVYDKLINSAKLPGPFFLQATHGVPGHVDHAAEKMQHEYRMENQYYKELQRGQGFSQEVTDYAFEKLIGYKVIRSKASSSNLILEPLSISVRTYIPTDEKRNNSIGFEPTIELRREFPEFYEWSLEGDSPLQTMIAKAAKDSSAKMFGGGLPPDNLIDYFYDNIFLPAWAATGQAWSRPEKRNVLRYPPAGGDIKHRKTVVDLFLGANERKTIIDNFSQKNRGDGLFMTYGSQEALYLMTKMLVNKEKATPDNPVEIAVTDPTYPGLLMAADEFLKQGVLKFRIVPLDKKTGQIDIQALETALKSTRCKAFYLAEGNPLPKQITNLEDVADVFKKDINKKKLVFEDRAYKGLGGRENDSLFQLLPNRVVAFETISKKSTPFRVGLVYSNMEARKFAYVKKSMLNYQYNSKLGFSGVLSGAVAAILELDAGTAKTSETGMGVFTEHVIKAQAYYEKQRKLYEKSYREALDLAFGEGEYDFEDEVVVGNGMFMFGWRNTHDVPANRYVKAGAKINLFSLSGSTCVPKSKYIVGDLNSNSKTGNHLRQNWTWIKPKNMRLGIHEDVLLEVIFSKMPEEERRKAIERLYDKLVQINGDRLPEVEVFIEKISKNHCQYSEELFK